MAKGLRHKRNQIDIYSNSWGPADNGYGIEGPSLEGQKSLKHGASQVYKRVINVVLILKALSFDISTLVLAVEKPQCNA